MEIKRKDKHTTKFKELTRGDVFEALGGIYLKFDTTYVERNAYNFQRNNFHMFGPDDEVVELRAELTVW